MPQIITTERAIYWAIEFGVAILKTGQTPAGAITATGYTVRQAESENDFLSELAGNESDFPALPNQGEAVEAGVIYNNGGILVLCRQSHDRTEHAVSTIPALFATYQAGAGTLQWVENEQVALGTVREYQGTLYKCIQAHQTQSDWQPPNVPALWAVYTEPSETSEWAIGVAYTIGDQVTYQGTTYECRQSHTSQVGWQPPNVPALWLAL